MDVKYRIVYDNSPKYKNNTFISKITPYLLPLGLCIAFALYAIYSPDSSKLYKFFLPGDPEITTDAFRKLSEAIRNSETASNALEIFCETILETR